MPTVLAALAGGVLGWVLKPGAPVSPSTPAGSITVAASRQNGPPSTISPPTPRRSATFLTDAVGWSEQLEIPGTDKPGFASLIREVLSEPSKEIRTAKFQLMLEKMSPGQLAGVVPVIREMDLLGTSNGDEWTLLFNQWGRTDGQGAMAFVQTFDWSGWGPKAPAEAQSRALSGWAASNLAAALAFVENPTGPIIEHGRSLQYSLLQGWVDRDPEAAGDWMKKRKTLSQDESALFLEALSRQKGPQAVEAWFAQAGTRQASVDHLEQLASAITETKIKYDPAAAAKWLETYSKSEWANSTDAFFKTGKALSQKDPVAAMDWAGRLSNQGAAVGAMDQWCRNDLPAASVWLRDHRSHPAYNNAVEVLASHVIKDDPEAARSWISTITDAASRSRMENALNQHQADKTGQAP